MFRSRSRRFYLMLLLLFLLLISTVTGVLAHSSMSDAKCQASTPEGRGVTCCIWPFRAVCQDTCRGRSWFDLFGPCYAVGFCF